MKISSLSSDFSFLLETKQTNIGVNEKTTDLSIFLQEQANETGKTVVHWPGEYEKKGVGMFLSDLGSKNYLAKVFAEHVRVVFFSSENVKYTPELKDSFGNTDILVLSYVGDSVSKSDIKHLIEAVDPRILIGSGESTEKLFSDISLPVQKKDSLSISKTSLPSEHTEYYIL